jgi:hypothetical protein
MALFVSGCGGDKVTVSVDVVLNGDAQAQVDAAALGELSIRTMYTADDLVDASNNQSIVVQPSRAFPVVDGGQALWNVSARPGYDYDLTTVSLVGIPTGRLGVRAIIEILRQGADGRHYPIAYGTLDLSGPNERLTTELLKSFNGSTVTIVKGRSCGTADPALDYTDFDADDAANDCIP